MSSRTRVAKLIAVAGALLLASTACTPTTSTAITPSGLERQPDGWRGLPVSGERELPDVTLTRTDGTPFHLADDLVGTPTLLFFGYTHCPDICPIHLAAIASSMAALDITYDEIDVVFVSVDPERDSPSRIDEYLAHFDRRMIGLHGSLEEVESALSSLELPGPVVEGPDPRGEGDLIGHPAHVIGFDAQGRGLRVWPFGARRSDWIADLPRVLEEWT